MEKSYIVQQMVDCKLITTCVTLEKPHCGISKGILACLTLHQMQYWKKELENKIEV